MKPLTVLAWDTATDWGAAALIRGSTGGPPWEILGSEVWDSGPHSQFLPPKMAALLAGADMAPAGADLIVAGRGPGGFTGLRTGLSLAQGLALGAGRPVLGVGTLLTLAVQMLEDDPEIPAAPLIDARHGEVFTALYRRAETAGPPEVLMEPRPVAPADLPEILSAAARGGTVKMDGPGRPLLPPGIEKLKNFKIPAGPPLRVSAVALAILGAEIFQSSAEAARLNPPWPLYIRQPDLRPAVPNQKPQG